MVRAVASTGDGSYTVRHTCSGKISSAVRVGCDSSLSVTFEGIVLLCDKQLPKSSPSNSFRLLIGESEKADDLTFITNNEGFLREIDVALMTAASSPKVVHLFAEEVESASAANRVPPSSSPAVKVVTSRHASLNAFDLLSGVFNTRTPSSLKGKKGGGNSDDELSSVEGSDNIESNAGEGHMSQDCGAAKEHCKTGTPNKKKVDWFRRH